MLVSIIIPTFNKLKYLDLTLASFVNQSHKDFEIIVVNDGGVNVDSLIKKYQSYMHIKSVYQENKGRAVARNRGLAIARGDIIIFNDDDRILDKKFIENHVYAISQNANTIYIGRKSRIITYWDRKRLPIKEEYIEKLQRRILPMQELDPDILWERDITFITSNDIIEDCIKIDDFFLDDAGDNFLDVIEKYSPHLDGFLYAWFLGTTANIAMSRALIGDTKFDEQYVSWGCEDIDFSYQMYQKGAKFYCLSEARNYHQIHPIGQGRYGVWDRIYQDRNNMKNLSYFTNKYNTLEVLILFKGFQNMKSIIEINEIYQKIKNNIVLSDNFYLFMNN